MLQAPFETGLKLITQEQHISTSLLMVRKHRCKIQQACMNISVAEYPNELN